MEITSDISTMFRTKRETKWITQLQQDTEAVKPYVTVHAHCSGNAVELPVYGKTAMQEYAGRFQKVEWQHLSFGKRTMRKRKFYNAIPLEEDDKIDMDTLDLTASNIMSEQRKAMARMNDEVILGVMKDSTTGKYRIRTQADGVCGGILGPNYTGEDGATVVELDTEPSASGTVIPVDFCAKGTKSEAGMLLDKVAELRRRIQMLDCFKLGQDEEIVLAITPKQHMDLLLLEQTQNRNYGFTSLTNGQVNAFLGVKLLVTNMLPTDEDGNRLCAAWIKSRIVFGVWKEAQFRIESRPEYVGVREQVLVKAASGATRKDETSVFLLPCKES